MWQEAQSGNRAIVRVKEKDTTLPDREDLILPQTDWNSSMPSTLMPASSPAASASAATPLRGHSGSNVKRMH